MDYFFELVFPTYKEIDRASKFPCNIGLQAISIMPGKGDAGDSSSLHNTEAGRCSEIEISAKADLLVPTIATTGPKYPELENLYKLHKTIGNGGFSKVKMATDLLTGNKVAIKIVDKGHVGAELPRINVEINTLQIMCHRYICRLINVLYSERKIFMIMEYCPTDLYEYIVHQDEYLTEIEARRIFIQLMSAVGYLHTNGIAHRDLKPENVLLDYDNNVKLADFGLCAVPKKKGINKAILTTMCGSPAYCAPELLCGPPYIGSKVDVWSLGVILFVLLSGQLPFYSKNLRDLYKKIQEVKYVIPDWISVGATDLIYKMLQHSPTIRPSLNVLWFHPWIQEGDLGDLQDQIFLAKEEAGEETLSGLADTRSMPMNVVGYMAANSRDSMLSKNQTRFEEKEALNPQEDTKAVQQKCLAWMSKGYRWLSHSISKGKKTFNKKERKLDEEPVEIDLTTLIADKTMTGLNVIDEEYADCILDKLQTELQSIGIPSKRLGSIVKQGIGSPCRFRFEVVSLEPLDLLFVRRRYIISKDPKIICNIMQKILLLSRGPP